MTVLLIRSPRSDSQSESASLLGNRFVGCVHSYKKNSPSSGLFRVKVYNDKGIAAHTGTGLFPRALMERLPLLPMEEEGRLNDLPLRENFIERVFRSPELARGPTTAGPRC